GDDERPPAFEHPDADLEGLGLADGVVDDVDVAGMAEGQALPWAAKDASGPTSETLDELEARFRLEHSGSKVASHLGLARPAGDRCHVDVGIELAQDRGRRRPE